MGGHDEDPRGFLPLTPAVLEILLALAEEDLHGYAIMREVERRTGGQVACEHHRRRPPHPPSHRGRW